ncbi:MAG: hypothetical protein GEU86_12135 [Actinophytocola sp.]|nr:hypothetical protein [Actinophytocola sp.]
MRTVIVRLFEPAEGAGDVVLSGFIEDVALGTKRPFSGGNELLTAIRSVVDHDETEAGAEP